MINYQPFLQHIQSTRLEKWGPLLEEQLQSVWSNLNDGNLPVLLRHLSQLPEMLPQSYNINQTVRILGKITAEESQQISHVLRSLKPWRKGPFEIFDQIIDAEWRCNLKWQRISPHISSLQDRHILDVGSGNGYYGWQMKQAGAATVAGIDPSWLSVVQHLAINHFIQDPSHAVLPLTLESLPADLECFDSVFSMGVLYHRRSPLDHINELRSALRPGGELILETLVVDGPDGYSLVPHGRYARMNNVWFLPTPQTLKGWLKKMGFEDIRIVDITPTSVDEQRSTEWKPGHSLSDYLNTLDLSKTIEGYPAPLRATLICSRPVQQRLKRYQLDT